MNLYKNNKVHIVHDSSGCYLITSSKLIFSQKVVDLQQIIILLKYKYLAFYICRFLTIHIFGACLLAKKYVLLLSKLDIF